MEDKVTSDEIACKLENLVKRMDDLSQQNDGIKEIIEEQQHDSKINFEKILENLGVLKSRFDGLNDNLNKLQNQLNKMIENEDGAKNDAPVTILDENSVQENRFDGLNDNTNKLMHNEGTSRLNDLSNKKMENKDGAKNDDTVKNKIIKTEACRLGWCVGKNCPFAHSQEEYTWVSHFKNNVCHKFRAGKRCTRKSCNFDHEMPNYVCNFSVRGLRCPYAQIGCCNFYHMDPECV